MTDEQITQAAREICALQAWKSSGEESQNYLNGNYDHTVWMRLVEQGIRKGIEQHEAFKQEVSDAAEQYNEAAAPMGWEGFDRFIITKPKPDPLVRVINEVIYAQPDGDINEATMAKGIRAALDALGFEIREKGQ